VQASVLVRATRFLGPARALPVRFEPAPPAVKPRNHSRQHTRKNQTNQKKNRKRKASNKTGTQAAQEKAAPLTAEEKEYRLQKKLRALTQVGVCVLALFATALDARPATRQRQLLVSGDGSYTNRTVLRQLPERTTFIGRIRKDAKLFQPLTLPPPVPVAGPAAMACRRPPPNKCCTMTLCR